MFYNYLAHHNHYLCHSVHESCWEGEKNEIPITEYHYTFSYFLFSINSRPFTGKRLLSFLFFSHVHSTLCFLESVKKKKKSNIHTGKFLLFFRGKKTCSMKPSLFERSTKKRYTDIVILWCVCWIFSIIVVVVVRRNTERERVNLRWMYYKEYIMMMIKKGSLYLNIITLQYFYSPSCWWDDIHSSDMKYAADDATSATHTWRKTKTKKTNVMSIIN